MECQYIIVYIFCEFNIHRISFRLKPLHVCRVNVMQNRTILHFKPIEHFCLTLSLTCLQIKLDIISSIDRTGVLLIDWPVKTSKVICGPVQLKNLGFIKK